MPGIMEIYLSQRNLSVWAGQSKVITRRKGRDHRGEFFMKNLLKIFGTRSRRLCAIALIAVIGLSFVSCGGDGDGDGVEKTLVAFMSTQIFNKGIEDVELGVFPGGTSLQAALNRIGFVAYGGIVDNQFINGGVRVTVPLYDAASGKRWTGSGTYDIYAVFYDSSYSLSYFRKIGVNISSGVTNIQVIDSDEFFP
jgi:hypothetical protein